MDLLQCDQCHLWRHLRFEMADIGAVCLACLILMWHVRRVAELSGY